MFGLFDTNRSDNLDPLIDALTAKMANEDVGSEEYNKLLASLERLMKLKGNKAPARVSRDTLVMAGANLLGILLIVAYEQKHVMTTKAYGTFIKPMNANRGN